MSRLFRSSCMLKSVKVGILISGSKPILLTGGCFAGSWDRLIRPKRRGSLMAKHVPSDIWNSTLQNLGGQVRGSSSLSRTYFKLFLPFTWKLPVMPKWNIGDGPWFISNQSCFPQRLHCFTARPFKATKRAAGTWQTIRSFATFTAAILFPRRDFCASRRENSTSGSSGIAASAARWNAESRTHCSQYIKTDQHIE